MTWSWTCPTATWSPVRGADAPALTDLPGAVRHALEHPFNFPALRRALTPDDHVAIAVDEHLPRLTEILVPLLEHIRDAGVAPEAITLLCVPPSTGQPWALELPDEFQDVEVEVHQPANRRKLSYLAATKQGRRVYINRTAVDADQLILLTGRGYDPRYGISGAETALYPNLSDEATAQEYATRLTLDAPGAEPWAIRVEAAEVAWLLGAPFLVQVIEGAGDEVVQVLGGTIESSSEGQRLLDARWHVTAEQPADIVIATIGGNPERHTFSDLAQAFYSAASVVQRGGQIVLLTDALPSLGHAAEIMGRHKDPMGGLRSLLKEKPPDLTAAFLWASAAEKAHLHLLSRLPADAVARLYASPLPGPDLVQGLLTGAATCLVLPDAHKTLATLRLQPAISQGSSHG